MTISASHSTRENSQLASVRCFVAKATRARLRSHPRNTASTASNLQPGLRRVLNSHGGLLDLTSAEFDLLHALVARSGRMLSREYLLDATNRGDGDAFDRSVDVLLSRIRRKLGDIEFQLIKTVPKRRLCVYRPC